MSQKNKIISIIISLIIIAGAVSYFALKPINIDDPEAVAKVTSILKPVFIDMSRNNWNREILDKYSNTSLKKILTDKNMTEGIPIYKRLGKMISFDDIYSHKISATELTAMSKVSFENSKVLIGVKMTNQGGRWLLNSMEIFPEKQIFK